jgi:hypothetical protein
MAFSQTPFTASDFQQCAGCAWAVETSVAGQRRDDAVREKVDDDEEQGRVRDEVQVTGPESVGAGIVRMAAPAADLLDSPDVAAAASDPSGDAH